MRVFLCTSHPHASPDYADLKNACKDTWRRGPVNAPIGPQPTPTLSWSVLVVLVLVLQTPGYWFNNVLNMWNFGFAISSKHGFG